MATKENKNSDEVIWNQDQQNNYILNTYKHLLSNELKTQFHEVMVIYGKEDFEFVQEFVRYLQNELQEPQISIVLYDDKQYKCFFHSKSQNNNEGEQTTVESMDIENVKEKSQEQHGDDAAGGEEAAMVTSTIRDSIDGQKAGASGEVCQSPSSGTQLIGANCDREKLCHHASVILVFLTKNITNRSFDKDMKDFLVLLSRTNVNVVPVYTTTSSSDRKEKKDTCGSLDIERGFLDDITGVHYSAGMFRFLNSLKRLIIDRFHINAHKKDVRRGQQLSWLRDQINYKKRHGHFSGLLCSTQTDAHKQKEFSDVEEENRCPSIRESGDDKQKQQLEVKKEQEEKTDQVESKQQTEERNTFARDSAERVNGILGSQQREEEEKKQEEKNGN